MMGPEDTGSPFFLYNLPKRPRIPYLKAPGEAIDAEAAHAGLLRHRPPLAYFDPPFAQVAASPP